MDHEKYMGPALSPQSFGSLEMGLMSCHSPGTSEAPTRPKSKDDHTELFHNSSPEGGKHMLPFFLPLNHRL